MSEKETACLRDITETDIMEYMQVEHPHNEKELWKMKHATPARIGIGRCGARYTTEAQLRFLAAHAAANDAVFNEVPEEVVKELGVFEVRTRCANKNEMLLRPDWGREFAGCQTKNCGKLRPSSAGTDLFRRRSVLAVHQGEHSGSVSNHKNGSGG